MASLRKKISNFFYPHEAYLVVIPSEPLVVASASDSMIQLPVRVVRYPIECNLGDFHWIYRENRNTVLDENGNPYDLPVRVFPSPVNTVPALQYEWLVQDPQGLDREICIYTDQDIREALMQLANRSATALVARVLEQGFNLYSVRNSTALPIGPQYIDHILGRK